MLAARKAPLCASLIACAFLLISIGCNANSDYDTQPKHPIILIPGAGGNQLEARLDKPSRVHWWCSRSSDWYQLWLSPWSLAPGAVDCFADNIRLVYDPASHTTSTPPGVETRVPGFGDTDSVEWLDAGHFVGTDYFKTMVQDLVDNLGYTRNVNIRGAPFDFRKAPNELGEYFSNIKQLIEDTYNNNGKRKVFLISHSMGGLIGLYLLHSSTQQWKDTYIEAFVPLATPWGGTVKTLRVFASGDNLDISVVSSLALRHEQRTSMNTAWLLPYDTFWAANEVLVSGPQGNYTVRDYQTFFRDIDFPVGYQMREDVRGLLDTRVAPGVPVHCLHGYDVDTPAGLTYSSGQWYDSAPGVVSGPGDGTVNLRSLNGCRRWADDQTQPVTHRTYAGVDHLGTLRDSAVLAYIKQVLV